MSSPIQGSERAAAGLSVQTESPGKVRAGKSDGHKIVEVPAHKTEGLTGTEVNGKSLSARKVEVAKTLPSLLSARIVDQAGQDRLAQQSDKALSLLFDTLWLQQRLDAGKPLTGDELDQLCEAALNLDEQIQKGAPAHTLAWRADALLGERIDTSSPEQLIGLTKKTLLALKQQSLVSGKVLNGQAFNEALRRLEDAEVRETPAERLVASSQALNILLDEHPNLPGQELLNSLQDHFSDQLQGMARDEFKAALKDQLSALERGGSKQEVILGFELGVAAAHLVGVNVGVRYTFDATALDDTRIQDRSTVTGSLDLVIGNGHIVRADIGGALSAGKGKLFESLDGLVDYHANSVLPVLLGSARKAHKNAAGVVKARRSDASHAQLVANRSQLQKQLIAQGIINPGDKLSVEDRRRADYLGISEKGLNRRVQVSALENMLAGKYSVCNIHTEFRRQVSVQDAFRSDPELLAKEPERYFSLHVKGQNLTGPEGRQWMKSTSQLLANLKAEYVHCAVSDPVKAETTKGMIERIRLDVREAIASLYTEYDHYSEAVNRHDSQHDTSSVKADVARLKHNLEQSRGSNGRAEFLRSVSATHAWLAKIHDTSFGPGLPPESKDKEAAKLFDRMEAEYRMPQMHLTDKQVKSTLSVQSSSQSTKVSKTGELKLKVPYAPVVLSAAVRTDHMEGHFNNDMNGDYLNVSVRVDAGANIPGILGSIQTGLPLYKKSGGNPQFASSLPTDKSFSLGVAGHLECHFIKSEDGYCLQYMRFSGEQGIGGASPEIPVVAGPWGNLQIKAEAAHHARSNLKEYVGDNTLTYFFTRYNGWANAGKASEDVATMRAAGQKEKAGSDYWDQFVHNNSSQVGKMMKNMSDPKTNVAKEFTKRLDEIGDDDFSLNIRTAFNAYKTDSSEQNYKAALAEFNEFMAECHKLDKAAEQAAFSMKKK